MLMYIYIYLYIYICFLLDKYVLMLASILRSSFLIILRGCKVEVTVLTVEVGPMFCIHFSLLPSGEQLKVEREVTLLYWKCIVHDFFVNRYNVPLNCPDHPSIHLQFSGYKYITQGLLLQIMTVELMLRTDPHPIPKALR